jgi:NAD+ synthase
MTGMSTALHITLAQINPIVGDLAYNANLIRKVRDKAPAHADLIVFPEMALCGYPPEDLVLKPVFLAGIAKTVRALAKESAGKRARLVVPAPVAGRGKIYNAAHLIGDGRILATVKKRHLPNYGVFDEQRLFTRGPAPLPVTVNGHKLGLMICEDMWFPDVAAALKDKGAEILVVVNASPYEITKHETRLKHARARVAETGLPLVCVNQVGGQDELVFDGASFVLSENGALVVQAGEFVEDVHHTVWNRTPSGHWLCMDGELRPTHAGPGVVYQAVMTGLRDYVTKNGFPGVIIGLSGGIDSALTAALAVDALGPGAVHGVMMPSKYTARESLDDAAALAKNLGIALDNISIESAVTAFESELKHHFTGHTPGIVHENIQPRCRGLILMALSNASGKMVLSTGNKSEVAVGYSTLYGDMCGGFSPLKDLYKMQVYELARWRNAHKPDHGLGPHGRVIPENSLTRAPTAELKPDQTDQDTLPPYEQLDAILECLLEKDMGPDEIAALGHDRKIVCRVWQMVDRAEYKRRQAAPGVKITSKAFGRDRRYPITHHFMASDDER